MLEDGGQGGGSAAGGPGRARRSGKGREAQGHPAQARDAAQAAGFLVTWGGGEGAGQRHGKKHGERVQGRVRQTDPQDRRRRGRNRQKDRRWRKRTDIKRQETGMEGEDRHEGPGREGRRWSR